MSTSTTLPPTEPPEAAEAAVAAVAAALTAYFDGLHHSDTGLLAEVFHPEAVYATATEGRLLRLTMEDYLPMVARREPPAARGEARRDRIVSIGFAGPVTALARVECAIGDRHYTDFLTLVRLDGRWRIIAKVFHFDLVDPTPTEG
ncbi:nuclear transport factor 2 family protein [Kitasatospora sp. NPDC127111]|uniref:nuclear transport factor 2 family protein n=1 Tax=Kitasatospora sp. NPDC127111 TaxID=3345363 RepID=UPI0036350E61